MENEEITFKEIKEILKQISIKLDKTAALQSKSEKEFREYRNQSEKEFREYRNQNEKEFREYQKQSEKEFREMREFQAKTDKNIDKISKDFGSFTNNQGDIIEILFFNALKEHLILDNIKYDFISLNEERISENTEQEFDIVLVNSNQVAIIEVKGKAHENDIKKLDTIVKNYRLLFPEHKNYKIQSYLGSLHFSKKVKEDVQETNHKLLLLKGTVIQVL